MTVVADLTVPTAQFVLAETLAEAPAVNVEFERVVTHSQEWVMPFAWVSGADLAAFEAAVREDDTVVEATIANEFASDRHDRVVLYRMRWSDHVKRLVNVIFDREGTLVEAVGSREGWELKVRFSAGESLSALQSHFDRSDVGFSVNRVYTPTEPRQPEFDVTPEQRDALVVAIESGYFAIPRRTTISQIADELAISTNAASERLRRGTANLVRTTLTVQDSITVDGEGDG